MQIVSIGDNLHEMPNPVFLGEIKKVSSVCNLLIALRVVNVKIGVFINHLEISFLAFP